MRFPISVASVSFAAFFAACTAKDAKTADTNSPAAAPAVEASSSAAEPTANDISNYKLDMDKMRKYAAALKGYQSLSATDSAAAEAASSEPNQSMAQTITHIESSPVAMKVLRDAGLTAKDYVWITAAYLQGAMTAALLESNKDAKLPEGQNPQNVEFVRAHRAELEGLVGAR
jgi:hypothetical protein